MSEAMLRLTDDEVWTALEAIDPVGVLAEELIDRTVGNEVPSAGKLSEWSDPRVKGADGAELVLLDHPEAAVRCVLPATGLRTFQAAALAALAARELLVRGGVTVAMLGASRAASPQLAVIARHVPDISHVALCLSESGEADRLEPKLLDQLELSGIGLSVVSTAAETVFGANLVVAAGDGGDQQDLGTLQPGQLARGTVVINGSGKGLPAELVDQMDRVYVDDLGLLEEHRDRYVVATHLAGSPEGQVRTNGNIVLESRWERRITADLGQLLTGRRPGRQHVDDVVLVELLSQSDLNAELAYRICRTAQRCGLGVEITN